MTTPIPKPTPEEQAIAYTGVRERVREVLVDADPDVVIPSCPDWSVQNLCAHLAGVAVALVNRDRPGADVQAWIDGHVDSRRDRSVESLLDEWDGSEFEQLILARPEGYGGLLYDVAAHEHDLRGALRRPGGRNTDAVRICLHIQEQMLSRDMAAKGVVGTITLSTDSQSIVGSHDADGSSSAQLALQLGGGDADWDLFRLLGSRRSLAQMARLPWRGALEPFLPAFEHLPFPTSDLVE